MTAAIALVSMSMTSERMRARGYKKSSRWGLRSRLNDLNNCHNGTNRNPHP